MIKPNHYQNTIYEFCKTFFFIFFLTYNSESQSSTTIKEIYASSTGNNIYEAQIKSKHIALEKAFKILWDKQQMIEDPLKNRITYSELKKIFTISKIEEERYVGNNYEGIFALQYDISSFYNFVFTHINKNSPLHNSFYEYLVIIIEKKNEDLKIVNEESSLFIENFYSKEIKETSLFIPNINNQELLDQIAQINFAEIEQMFHKILFKNILFLTYEVFTSSQDMSYLLKINHLKIDYNDHKRTKNFSIKLPNNNIQNQHLLKILIHNLIHSYNKLQSSKTYKIKKTNSHKKSQIPDQKINFEKISFYLTTDNNQILNIVKEKLSKINKSIESYKITKLKKHEYVVQFELKGSLEDLSEEFYLLDLSYVIQGDNYYLLNLSSGV